MEVIQLKPQVVEKKKTYKKRNNLYKKGNYWYYVHCPMKDGNPKWVSTGQKEKNLAQLWVNENIIRPQLNSELGLNISSNFTVKDFVNKFYWPYAEGNNGPKTVSDNRYRMKILLKFMGNYNLKDVNYHLIQEYFNQRSKDRSRNDKTKIISKCSLNRERSLMSKVFSLAVKYKYVGFNPVRDFDKYNETQFKRAGFVLKEDDFIKLLKYFNQKNEYGKTEFLYFSYFLGCRRSSLLNLKWVDCDLRSGRIYLSKTKNKIPQWISIGSFLHKLLMDMKGKVLSEYVFCKANGDKRKCIKNAFQIAIKKAGLEGYRWHDISRHSAVSRMANQGYNWEQVKEITGHQTYTAFQNYKHHFDDKKQVEMIEKTNQKLINKI
ncbi:MAG: site-specific integrase [Pseudomonadota bacterium]